MEVDHWLKRDYVNILDLNKEIFIICIISFSLESKMSMYLVKKAQITLLMARHKAAQVVEY